MEFLTNYIEKSRQSEDVSFSIEETKLLNMEKFITIKDSHTFIASNPVVIKEAVEFLKQKSKKYTKY